MKRVAPAPRARVPRWAARGCGPAVSPLAGPLTTLAAALALSACHHYGAPGYLRAERAHAPVVSLVEEAQRPGAEARWRSAAVLAIVAPEPCSTSPAAASGETALLALPCGQLMSELETRAIGRGFRVLGWRSWVGQSDPTAAARRSGADLVIRLREVDAPLQPGRQLVAGRTRWTLRTVAPQPAEGDLMVANPEVIHQRCAARFDALSGLPLAATRLLAEALDPATGAPDWQLSRTLSQWEGADGVFRAEHGVRVRPRIAATGAPAYAGLMAAVGGVVGGWYADKPVVLSASLGLAVGAAVALALAPKWMDAWPKPEPLLCAEGDAHWMAPAATAKGDLPPHVRKFAREVVSRLAGDGGQQVQR
ncbi:MAG: hypothetical protein FJ100_02895 [Deltaproteobacteria bacterium]|nr:hypothetical protein [Deltaproteobacteria bacterium]